LVLKHPCSGCSERDQYEGSWCRFSKAKDCLAPPVKKKDIVGCKLIDVGVFGFRFADIAERWKDYSGDKIPLDKEWEEGSAEKKKTVKGRAKITAEDGWGKGGG